MRAVWRVFATLFFAMGWPAFAQQVDRPAIGTLLQIEAKGSVKATPDQMTVYAAVVTSGATAAQALDRNNELAGRLIEGVKKSGIRIGTLRTSRLSVNARFAEGRRDNDQPSQILGYVAQNELEVELAEVAQAGNLISLMFDAGANEIRGPIFNLKDPAHARLRAERAAITDARAEAENYATALGMKVSRVVRIFDRNFRDEGDDHIVITGSRVRPTPVEPGEITFEVTLHVEFLLEPR